MTTNVHPYTSIAWEWGINFIQLNVLFLVRDEGPIEWTSRKIHRLTGQPGHTVRTLIERGFLDGASPEQSIRAKLFTLTHEGRELLAKIERGLYPPKWLKATQVEALRQLSESGASPPTTTIHSATLRSLRRVGYVSDWALTDLGQEAWRAYQNAKESGDLIGDI